MDYFKTATIKDYSSWDIKSKYVANDKKLEKQFKRKARRKLNFELKNNLEVCYEL